jgi:cell division protein FtsN
MRDVERLREKHEFSLDDRQIAALAFCTGLLFAGVFALGLMLGRHSAPPPAPDLAAMDEAAKKPAAEEVAPNRPTARAPAPQAAPAPPPAPAAEAAEEEAPEQGKPPESLAAQPPPARPAQHAQADAPHALVPPPQRTPMVVPPPPRPVQVASTATVELPPPPKDPGQFTVQVGASQDRADARKLVQRALTGGLKPYVVEADLGAKGTWYRVRVGAFADKDAATRYRKDVERELRSPAVVMSTR